MGKIYLGDQIFPDGKYQGIYLMNALSGDVILVPLNYYEASAYKDDAAHT